MGLLTLPRTFANLTTALLSYLDDNFVAIRDLINGNLDATNVTDSQKVVGIVPTTSPAANKIPISGSDGKIAAGWIPVIGSGASGFQSAFDNADSSYLDLLFPNVIAGDILLITGALQYGGSAPTAAAARCYNSGLGTALWEPWPHNWSGQFYRVFSAEELVSQYGASFAFLIVVTTTGNGTLSIRLFPVDSGGSGKTMQLSGCFLLKQS
jgi:hypothetical protein